MVDLYYVVERKNEFVGYGTESKTHYNTRQVSVPRCAKCARIHSIQSKAIGALGALVVLGGLGMIATLVYVEWGAGTVDAVAVLAAIIGGGLLTLMAMMVVGLLWAGFESLLDLIGINTERRARRYPAIEALLRRGWKVGSKPPYKGDDVQRRATA